MGTMSALMGASVKAVKVVTQ